MNKPIGESIWGNINTCIEITRNIYSVTVNDESGIEKTGIMAHKDSVGRTLSKKAASMAEQDGNWLCFDEGAKDIPMYEVLEQRAATYRRMESQTLRKMEEIKRDGKLTLTNYFGECNPPTESNDGVLSDIRKVCNGIFFTYDKNNFNFAVHEAIADNYLSSIVSEFAQRYGDYLFYDTTTSAIPLNELKNIFGECEELIVSEDSLYATINRHFSGYMAVYNENLQKECQIPEVEATTSLFLQVQLDQANETEVARADVTDEQDFEIDDKQE